jgi:hypothetical protein
MARKLGRCSSRPLLVAAVLLGLGGASVRTARAQGPDSLSTWLDWGSLAFLIRADTVHGVQLWANALVALKDGAEPRTFVARYDPAAMVTWALDAELLLLPDQVGPNDPPNLLSITPLTDLQGGQFIAARRREGARWARRVVLSFNARGDPPLTVSVDQAQATELLTALAAAARRSRLPDPRFTARLNSCGNTDSALVHAERVTSGPVRYPVALRNQGIPGLAVVSFIVGADGRPDTEGDAFRVIFSSHPAFTDAARDAVASSRFLPAIHDGKPTPVSVCQPVLFMITTSARAR